MAGIGQHVVEPHGFDRYFRAGKGRARQRPGFHVDQVDFTGTFRAKQRAQRVQHILHLSDAEIMSITRFERGQGLISTNSNHITVSFKASPLEKQLITTDRMELNQILKEKIAQNTHNVVE